MLKKLFYLYLALLSHVTIGMEPPLKKVKPNPIETCQFLATPRDNIVDIIVRDINAIAKDGYIGIEAVYFNNSLVKNSVIEAAQRGVNVKIWIDKSESFDPYKDQFDDLTTKNIKIIPVDTHAKRIVILKKIDAVDNRVVYLGSLNLSENAPYNHEIMMRCTDTNLFQYSFNDQYRIGQPFYDQPKPIDFASLQIVHSSYPQAQDAKKKFIKEFELCIHPHDYLYFAAYTLEDQEILQLLIGSKQTSKRPVTVILDGKNWKNEKLRTTVLKPLVTAGVTVYIFNKDGSKKTPQGHEKLMHIKAMLRSCDQRCTSFISTANFIPREKN